MLLVIIIIIIIVPRTVFMVLSSGAPKSTPGDKVHHRNPWGDKNKKFGQLILRKIIKIVATRCHIFRLKFTKFDFGWGFAPDPAGGAHSAPPDPLAGLKWSCV